MRVVGGVRSLYKMCVLLAPPSDTQSLRFQLWPPGRPSTRHHVHHHWARPGRPTQRHTPKQCVHPTLDVCTTPFTSHTPFASAVASGAQLALVYAHDSGCIGGCSCFQQQRPITAFSWQPRPCLPHTQPNAQASQLVTTVNERVEMRGPHLQSMSLSRDPAASGQ